jgi:hypothetical protein
MMRTKAFNLIILTLALIALCLTIPVMADSMDGREYKVKAAFLYNFINFVDWPEANIADSNQPITIGIIGSRDFLKAFEPVKHRRVKGRKIIIKYFSGYEKLKNSQDTDKVQWNKKMETLKSCHVLLLCNCGFGPIENSDRIIRALKGSPVLTVSETGDFLESGGMINFLMEGDKVRFEINNTAARQAKLQIRSKLLRLAKRVIGEKSSNGAKN